MNWRELFEEKTGYSNYNDDKYQSEYRQWLENKLDKYEKEIKELKNQIKDKRCLIEKKGE